MGEGQDTCPAPLRRLRAEFRCVAAVTAASLQIGTAPQPGVRYWDKGEGGLAAISMAFQCLLEAPGGRLKV